MDQVEDGVTVKGDITRTRNRATIVKEVVRQRLIRKGALMFARGVLSMLLLSLKLDQEVLGRCDHWRPVLFDAIPPSNMRGRVSKQGDNFTHQASYRDGWERMRATL